MEAAREATRRSALAVLATTLSLVVIFVPVSFMSRISGRFLYQFGITAAVAVLVRLLVSFTLTPMMSARCCKRRSAATAVTRPASRSGFLRRDRSRLYMDALRFAMRHRHGGRRRGVAGDCLRACRCTGA